MIDEKLISACAQEIRVNIRWGVGISLVPCNGIGASLPYRFPYLAAVVGRLLEKAGVVGGTSGESQVHVLGLSWGGAPTVRFQNPRGCRRLILVSTGTGSIMIPGKPSVLVKTMTPRRFMDHGYGPLLAPELYGASARRNPMMIKHVFDRQQMAGSWLGYHNPGP